MTELLLYLRDFEDEALTIPMDYPVPPTEFRATTRPPRLRAPRILRRVSRVARWMARVHGARTPDGGAH